MDSVLYFEEFVLWQSAAGKAAGTIRNYRKALGKFGDWLSEQDGMTAQDVTPADLARYVHALREQYPPDQVNISISALRVYFRWLAEEELRTDGQNPTRRLKFLPVRPRPVESLSKQECQRLVRWAAGARKQRFGVYRTAVLAVLLLDTGLRVGEALSLRLSDLGVKEGRCLVTKGKSKGFPVVPLSIAVRRHLRHYLLHRERKFPDSCKGTDLVFLSEAGGPCTVGAAERSFRNLRRKVGIPNLHPHLLRHTFATQSLLNGAPLPTVMRLGGWRKLSTVQRYTYMNDSVAAEVHSRTSPLASAAGQGGARASA
jgi:integrase/recombinase XerD